MRPKRLSIKKENKMENNNENPALNIPAVISGYIYWLEDRIKKTQIEKDTTDDMNIKIGKGGKLCVYKEVLNYIREHNH